jgi:hypothetical protein
MASRSPYLEQPETPVLAEIEAERIQAECLQIQSEWSDRERMRRRGIRVDKHGDREYISPDASRLFLPQAGRRS